MFAVHELRQRSSGDSPYSCTSSGELVVPVQPLVRLLGDRVRSVSIIGVCVQIAVGTAGMGYFLLSRVHLLSTSYHQSLLRQYRILGSKSTISLLPSPILPLWLVDIST